MAVLRGAMVSLTHIEAPFRDFPSLHQKPAGGDGTEAEKAAFGRSLDEMGDLYASAIVTTVLQLREIPRRPPEIDGEICLCNLEKGATEERARLEFGELGGSPTAACPRRAASHRPFGSLPATRRSPPGSRFGARRTRWAEGARRGGYAVQQAVSRRARGRRRRPRSQRRAGAAHP